MSWVKKWYFKQIAWVVALGVFIIGSMPAESLAYVVGARPDVAATRAADMDKVQRVLESKLVAKRLGDMGLSVEEITKRLGKLTDEELHSFASQLDHLYPGGNAAGALIAILIIIILVLVILKLTDRKIIIK